MRYLFCMLVTVMYSASSQTSSDSSVWVATYYTLVSPSVPVDMMVDINGNLVYLDNNKGELRRINSNNITTTRFPVTISNPSLQATLLGSNLTNANAFTGDIRSNVYYVPHWGWNAILKFVPGNTTGIVWAGGNVSCATSRDGIGVQACFNTPQAIAIHVLSNRLFVTDRLTPALRVIDLTTVQVSTVTVDTRLTGYYMSLSRDGLTAYLTSFTSGLILAVTTDAVSVTAIAGKAGATSAPVNSANGTTARFSASLMGVALNYNETQLCVADSGNTVMRRVATTPIYGVATVAGRVNLGFDTIVDGANGTFGAVAGLRAFCNATVCGALVADTGARAIRFLSYEVNPVTNTTNCDLTPLYNVGGGLVQDCTIRAQALSFSPIAPTPTILRLVRVYIGTVFLQNIPNNTAIVMEGCKVAGTLSISGSLRGVPVTNLSISVTGGTTFANIHGRIRVFGNTTTMDGVHVVLDNFTSETSIDGLFRIDLGDASFKVPTLKNVVVAVSNGRGQSTPNPLGFVSGTKLIAVVFLDTYLGFMENISIRLYNVSWTLTGTAESTSFVELRAAALMRRVSLVMDRCTFVSRIYGYNLVGCVALTTANGSLWNISLSNSTVDLASAVDLYKAIDTKAIAKVSAVRIENYVTAIFTQTITVTMQSMDITLASSLRVASLDIDFASGASLFLSVSIVRSTVSLRIEGPSDPLPLTTAIDLNSNTTYYHREASVMSVGIFRTLQRADLSVLDSNVSIIIFVDAAISQGSISPWFFHMAFVVNVANVSDVLNVNMENVQASIIAATHAGVVPDTYLCHGIVVALMQLSGGITMGNATVSVLNTHLELMTNHTVTPPSDLIKMLASSVLSVASSAVGRAAGVMGIVVLGAGCCTAGNSLALTLTSVEATLTIADDTIASVKQSGGGLHAAMLLVGPFAARARTVGLSMGIIMDGIARSKAGDIADLTATSMRVQDSHFDITSCATWMNVIHAYNRTSERGKHLFGGFLSVMGVEYSPPPPPLSLRVASLQTMPRSMLQHNGNDDANLATTYSWNVLLVQNATILSPNDYDDSSSAVSSAATTLVDQCTLSRPYTYEYQPGAVAAMAVCNSNFVPLDPTAAATTTTGSFPVVTFMLLNVTLAPVVVASSSPSPPRMTLSAVYWENLTQSPATSGTTSTAPYGSIVRVILQGITTAGPSVSRAEAACTTPTVEPWFAVRFGERAPRVSGGGSSGLRPLASVQWEFLANQFENVSSAGEQGQPSLSDKIRLFDGQSVFWDAPPGGNITTLSLAASVTLLCNRINTATALTLGNIVAPHYQIQQVAPNDMNSLSMDPPPPTICPMVPLWTPSFTATQTKPVIEQYATVVPAAIVVRNALTVVAMSTVMLVGSTLIAPTSALRVQTSSSALSIRARCYSNSGNNVDNNDDDNSAPNDDNQGNQDGDNAVGSAVSDNPTRLYVNALPSTVAYAAGTVIGNGLLVLVLGMFIMPVIMELIKTQWNNHVREGRARGGGGEQARNDQRHQRQDVSQQGTATAAHQTSLTSSLFRVVLHSAPGTGVGMFANLLQPSVSATIVLFAIHTNASNSSSPMAAQIIIGMIGVLLFVVPAAVVVYVVAWLPFPLRAQRTTTTTSPRYRHRDRRPPRGKREHAEMEEEGDIPSCSCGEENLLRLLAPQSAWVRDGAAAEKRWGTQSSSHHAVEDELNRDHKKGSGRVPPSSIQHMLRRFQRRYEPIYDGYRDENHGFFAVEWSTAFACGVLDAASSVVVTTSNNGCGAIPGILLGVCILFLALLIWRRPANTIFDNGSSVVQAVMTAIVALLCVIPPPSSSPSGGGGSNGDDGDDSVGDAANGLALAQNIVLLISMLLTTFPELRKRLREAHPSLVTCWCCGGGGGGGAGNVGFRQTSISQSRLGRRYPSAAGRNEVGTTLQLERLASSKLLQENKMKHFTQLNHLALLVKTICSATREGK